MIFNKIWHGPAAAVSHYYPFFRCYTLWYGICFYKNILQHYHKIEKSKTAEEREREWEYNKNIVLTTSKHLTRIKNTTTAVCVGFKRLRNADVLHFYSPISPALVPTDPFRYVERTFCANHVGKLMENVILASGCVCVVCVCVGVDWSATSSSKKEKRKEEGNGKEKGGGFKGFS